jgi:hypothetical protein
MMPMMMALVMMRRMAWLDTNTADIARQYYKDSGRGWLSLSNDVLLSVY